MIDYRERELKGHSILAVERFDNSTKWMIEFIDKQDFDEYRLFLDDCGYQKALDRQKKHEIKIKRYAHVTEGHIVDFKPSKRRGPQ